MRLMSGDENRGFAQIDVQRLNESAIHSSPDPLRILLCDRVGGEVTLAVLPHHRTCGSAYGGS